MTSEPSGWLETQLLVACVSHDKVPYPSTDVRWHVSQKPDWHLLLSLAGFHGLLPLLTQALEDIHWVDVPSQIREKLLRRNALHIKDSVLKMRELLALNRQFEERQLEVVNWKGLTLAASLYTKPTLRESCDFDFLVAEHEMEDTIDVLTSLGFKQQRKASTERGSRLIAKYDGELSFLRERDMLCVELHTEFLPQQFGAWQDIQPALHRATMQEFPGGKLLALHPEDLLLSLCAHGIKHHWGRLKWLADIARFAEVYRYTLDWRLLLRNTRSLGQTQAVLHSFLLAEAVFGVRVPEELTEQPNDQIAEVTARRAAALLEASPEEISDEELGDLLRLLFPGKIEAWLFSLRRMIEPQPQDLAGDIDLIPHLTKFRRLHRQVGWAGMVEKVKISFGVDA